MGTKALISGWLMVGIVWAGILGAQPAEPGPVADDGDSTITVFLVRHAEKVRDPDVGDPPLTEAGQRRARDLARTLSEAEIDIVFTTQWLRTRETAAPLAASREIEPRVIEARGNFIARMASLVGELGGKNVLVVGHSDTTPELARALGAEAAPDIADNDFDDLYQVVITPTERRFVHLRYGHPTP